MSAKYEYKFYTDFIAFPNPQQFKNSDELAKIRALTEIVEPRASQIKSMCGDDWEAVSHSIVQFADFYILTVLLRR